MTNWKNERLLVSLNTHVRCDLTITIHGIFLLLSLLPGAAAADTPMAPPDNPYGIDRKFSPSMAIIIVILISAFFFMGFFSVYLRQCAGEGGATPQTNGQRGGGRSRRGARGLDWAVIETFPTFIYSVVKGLKLGKGTLECAVCLSEFQDDDALRLLPKCDHVFHPDCIDAWLASHTTCPVCRANLVPDPAAVAAEHADLEVGSEEDTHTTANDVAIPIEDERSRQDPAILPEARSGCVLTQSVENRPPRTKSTRWSRFTGKYPRSHSTGHSLVQKDNYERNTLRLPENVRKDFVSGKLNRTISCVVFPTEGGSVSGSSRVGYKVGEGSSRGRSLRYGRVETVVKSDRWVFSMAPPFLSRTFSSRSPREGADGDHTSSKPVVFREQSPTPAPLC